MADVIAAAGKIKSRSEFCEVLAQTLSLARRRSASSPLWVHGAITAQLQAMTQWTALGRTPTPEERDRITIGVIANGEFGSGAEGEDAHFVECLIQLAVYFEQWPDDWLASHTNVHPADSLSPGCQLLLTRRVGLISSVMHLEAGTATPHSVRAALSADAEHVRLPGLPDELNPLVLDPRRVEAFIEGLPRQPENTLRRIEARWLALGVEGLCLSTSSPVEADVIADGFQLEIPSDEATVVQARLRVPMRRDYAQSVAARAKAALSEFEAEVTALEARGAVASALTQARWRRFAAAAVWRTASRSLAGLSLGFRNDFQRASDAVGWYAMPPWIGLPPR